MYWSVGSWPEAAQSSVPLAASRRWVHGERIPDSAAAPWRVGSPFSPEKHDADETDFWNLGAEAQLA